MTANTTAAATTNVLVNGVTDLEFIQISDLIEVGQWADWQVRFYIGEEQFSGFLQACPRHPSDFHHSVIEDCERL